jgi:FHA domain
MGLRRFAGETRRSSKAMQLSGADVWACPAVVANSRAIKLRKLEGLMASQPLTVKLLFHLLHQSIERAREALGAMHALVPLEPWLFEDGEMGDISKVTSPGSGNELFATASGIQTPAWRAPAYPLTGEIQRVGRSWRSDLIIDQPTVSATHAEISQLSGVFRVSDPGSRNGTMVNSALLSLNSLTRLEDGDVVVFGEAQTVFGGLDHLAAMLHRARVARVVTRRDAG